MIMYIRFHVFTRASTYNNSNNNNSNSTTELCVLFSSKYTSTSSLYWSVHENSVPKKYKLKNPSTTTYNMATEQHPGQKKENVGVWSLDQIATPTRLDPAVGLYWAICACKLLMIGWLHIPRGMHVGRSQKTWPFFLVSSCFLIYCFFFVFDDMTIMDRVCPCRSSLIMKTTAVPCTDKRREKTKLSARTRIKHSATDTLRRTDAEANSWQKHNVVVGVLHIPCEEGPWAVCTQLAILFSLFFCFLSRSFITKPRTPNQTKLPPSFYEDCCTQLTPTTTTPRDSVFTLEHTAPDTYPLVTSHNNVVPQPTFRLLTKTKDWRNDRAKKVYLAVDIFARTPFTHLLSAFCCAVLSLSRLVSTCFRWLP